MARILWRDRGGGHANVRSDRRPFMRMRMNGLGIFRDSLTFFAHFPIFPHIFRTFSVKILSFPLTVLKFWDKNRFVLRVTE